LKKYSFVAVILVILGAVVAFEWYKRSKSAHSTLASQSDDLISSAAIRTPETDEY
jgi:hypothetical protein